MTANLFKYSDAEHKNVDNNPRLRTSLSGVGRIV